MDRARKLFPLQREEMSKAYETLSAVKMGCLSNRGIHVPTFYRSQCQFGSGFKLKLRSLDLFDKRSKNLSGTRAFSKL